MAANSFVLASSFENLSAMIISAGDNDWESRLSGAFAQRIQFELRDIDRLNLSRAEFYKLVSGWSLKQRYTPCMVSETGIRFRPNESPGEPSLWDLTEPRVRA